MDMITNNTTLDIKNLITARFKATQAQMQPLVKGLMDYIESSGAKKVGFPISATYSVDPATQVLDTEFYIPIDKEIPSNSTYIFKPRLYLTNCVMITHKGNPNFLENTVGKLNNYIIENKLTPISVGFNVNRNEITRTEDLHLLEFDMYVSISPNEI